MPKKVQVERKIKHSHKRASESRKLKEEPQVPRPAAIRQTPLGTSVQLLSKGAWEFSPLASGPPDPREPKPSATF